jgi:hypothetical protein
VAHVEGLLYRFVSNRYERGGGAFSAG